MKFGSLFSGVGGFDLGFEWAGIKGAWQIEKDNNCNRVLAKRFPLVARYPDVTNCERMPAIDVLCGGFPCQDLSVAGKREGLAGERSGLWFEFLRIIESNLPRIAVIENVPGLLSSNGGEDFAVILRGLVECGYRVAWRILDAQYFGVAQRRRRLFIVGSLGGGSCAQILFESEGSGGHPATRREARSRVAPILEIGARTNGDGNRDGDGIGIEGNPMFTLQSGKQHGVAYERDIAHTLRSEGADASEDGTGRGVPLVAATLDHRGRGPTDSVMMNLVCTPEAFSVSGHGEYREGVGTLRAHGGDVHGGSETLIAFHENKSGQLSEAEVLGLRSGASHSYQGVGGESGVRRLTPRECERLQGFPDDWTLYDVEGKVISDSARYRMLGNAVAVPCANWLAERIVSYA